jgi:hypothetical protein
VREEGKYKGYMKVGTWKKKMGKRIDLQCWKHQEEGTKRVL